MVPQRYYPPEARDHYSAVLNASHNTFIAFGGSLAFFGTDEDDTRVLSPANGSTAQWTALSPSGSPPPVREGQSAVLDNFNNMIMFGGADSARTCCPYEINSYNDVWVLSDADGRAGNPTWTELSPLGNPPAPRQDHATIYDPVFNRMYVLGGAQFSNTTQSWLYFSDVWMLTYANGQGGEPKWTQVGQYGTPPGANFQFSGTAYDSAHRRIIAVGDLDDNETPTPVVFVLDLAHH